MLRPGAHGLFVTEYGASPDHCWEMGNVFNPQKSSDSYDLNTSRRVGELDQPIVDDFARASYKSLNHKATLFGPDSIVGRGIALTMPEGMVSNNSLYDELWLENRTEVLACCSIILSANPIDTLDD